MDTERFADQKMYRRTPENRYLTDTIFVNRVKALFADRNSYPNFLSVLAKLRQEVRVTDDPKSQIQVLRLAVKEGVMSPMLNGTVVESLRGDLQHVRHRRGEKLFDKVRTLARQEETSSDMSQLIARYKDLSNRVQDITERVDLTNSLSQGEATVLRELQEVQDQLLVSDWPHASKLQFFFDEAGLGWLWGVDEKTEEVPEDGRIGDKQMYNW